MGVRLDENEAWALVEASHTGILTTLRRDGTPIALPVWFVALDRRVYVSGPSTTKRLARIGRDPRVSFLVEGGERWAELRAVHLNGRASVVDDGELLARVAAAGDQKYAAFRTARTAMPDATLAHYDVRTATIEIVPEGRLLTWDNRKLGLAPGAP